MNINIQVVTKQEIQLRKGFTGTDWWFDGNDDLQVRVEKMYCPFADKYEVALTIHETLEALHCNLLGITAKQVDDFDAVFEKQHPDNHGLNAGDAPGCPYAVPHSLATAPERVYAACAGICWEKYDLHVGSL